MPEKQHYMIYDKKRQLQNQISQYELNAENKKTKNKTTIP